MNRNNQTKRPDSTKIPFWPTKYQVIGFSGCLLGTIGGPCLMYASILLMDWLFPNTIHYSLFYMFGAVLLSIPVGTLLGTAIGMAIAERVAHRK